jgi:hypothetical protein
MPKNASSSRARTPGLQRRGVAASVFFRIYRKCCHGSPAAHTFPRTFTLPDIGTDG